MTQQFAYGYWTVAGVGCPITQAGGKDHSYATDVAELFDANVSEDIECDKSQGVVSYNVAQQEFNRVKQSIEQRIDSTYGREKERYENMLELAEEVEQEVFNDD
jgi:hypothetical protein